MKVIILAAGKTLIKYGFPKYSKPKCLFHHKGEALLERQIRIFKDLGLLDIRIVTGYRASDIINFMIDRRLKVEVAYNHEAIQDKHVNMKDWVHSMKSVRRGLFNVDDDVIISNGDVYFDTKHIKVLMEASFPSVLTGNGGIHVFKFSKNLVKKLRKIRASFGLLTTYHFCMKNGGTGINFRDLYDIDFYNQTDESKNGRG